MLTIEAVLKIRSMIAAIEAAITTSPLAWGIAEKSTKPTTTHKVMTNPQAQSRSRANMASIRLDSSGELGLTAASVVISRSPLTGPTARLLFDVDDTALAQPHSTGDRLRNRPKGEMRETPDDSTLLFLLFLSGNNHNC